MLSAKAQPNPARSATAPTTTVPPIEPMSVTIEIADSALPPRRSRPSTSATVACWAGGGAKLREASLEDGAAAEFDPEGLAGLEGAVPRADFDELVACFLENAEARLDRIRHLADYGDLDGLRREAHALTSTAGNMGALRVSELARKLETACREGSAERAVDLARTVDTAGPAALAAVRARFPAAVA